MNDKKILLFAHPRSGSTTLMNVLNVHKDINIMHEPFNEERENWYEDNKNYLNETKTIEDLDRVLEEIHEKHNGFKHLSYQLPEDLTEHLLTKKGYSVIFQQRKNHLQGMVSAFIAEQTNIWQSEDVGKHKEPSSLKSLDIGKIKKEIEYLKHDLALFKNMLQKAGTPLFEISYEDFLVEGEEDKLRKLEEVFSFLDLEFPNDEVEEIKRLISPKRKIANDNIYNLVPNIQEIEKELGSEEDGFLFK